MLRNGGELDGTRILSPAMIEYASRNHTGELRNVLFDYTASYRGWEAWPGYIGLAFSCAATASLRARSAH